MKFWKIDRVEFTKRAYDGAWMVWGLLTNLDHVEVSPQWILLNVSPAEDGLEGLHKAHGEVLLESLNFKYPYPSED
jgi:hypothetical protein